MMRLFCKTPKFSALIMMLLAGCLVLTACGSDGDDATPRSSASTDSGSSDSGGSGGGSDSSDKGDDPTPPSVNITLKTGRATFVTDCTAIFSGTITNIADLSSEAEIGFVYSYEYSEPTLDNSDKVECTISWTEPTIEGNADYLKADTKYYYCSYVLNDGLAYYGDVVTFTTPKTPETQVDMGLSVYWANHNVGGYNPEDFGGYYAWAETEEKEIYEERNTKYFDGYWKDNGKQALWNKYVFYNGGGVVDNKTRLDLWEDVARVEWGNPWRTPTKIECETLLSERNTDKKMVKRHGVLCLLLVSKLNGNFIFLPYAGVKGSKLWDVGEALYYSTSDMYNGLTEWGDNRYAICGWLLEPIELDARARFFGMPVRPVKSK